MLTEILEAFDVVHPLVIGQDGDHLVIDFTAVIKGHHPDDACFNDRTRDKGLRDTDDLDVERVTVLVPGAGYAAVGKGVSQ